MSGVSDDIARIIWQNRYSSDPARDAAAAIMDAFSVKPESADMTWLDRMEEEPPDRRDRDVLTDHDDLESLLVQHQRHRADCLCGWGGLGRSLPGHQADVILAAGWVHWPHDCDTEAELIAQWAHTSFDNMQELHRLAAENAALRRRLMEAGALDPAEQVVSDD